MKNEYIEMSIEDLDQMHERIAELGARISRLMGMLDDKQEDHEFFELTASPGWEL